MLGEGDKKGIEIGEEQNILYFAYINEGEFAHKCRPPLWGDTPTSLSVMLRQAAVRDTVMVKPNTYVKSQEDPP